MTEHILTRSNMVQWMQTEGGAEVDRLPCRNWRNLNVAVAEQPDAGFNGKLSDFHLLEFHLAGNQRSKLSIGEGKEDHVASNLLPTSITYIPSQAKVTHTVEGSATIQQVYIDTNVFEETKAAVVPGDPDTLQLIAFHGRFDPLLKSLLSRVLDEARIGAIGGELFADTLAQQIALQLIRDRINGRVKKQTSSALSDGEIKSVIDFMETDLADVGGLQALAVLVDMDTFTFSRAFKAKTGQTPHQFLIERRLMRVKDMLLYSNERLVDITYATGFSNQAHMTTTFSKQYGMPPGAWRKMVRS